ncbi:hypothetical protein ACN0IV_11680 [Trabulsiella odontotermitis]|uniref:hypothetical protein n=1 Tax=Trabulsiella odontotermitis TaxID=379893 RepID=UPI003AC0D3CB
MAIQSIGSTASLWNTISRKTEQQQDFKNLMAKVTDAANSSSTDKVQASTSSNGVTQSRTTIQEDILRYARADSQDAERLAHDMAYSRSDICYDLTESIKTNRMEDIKLASTGEKVGDDYKRQFYQNAAKIDAQRMQIYNTEKAKGTDPVIILSKMIDFTNTQSRDYLAATGWLA